MKYIGDERRPAPELTDKASIRKMIPDMKWEFSRAELQEIIHREFFDDENPLDAGLVDAAIARLLILDGIDLQADTLQRERERIVYGILKEILQTKE